MFTIIRSKSAGFLQAHENGREMALRDLSNGLTDY